MAKIHHAEKRPPEPEPEPMTESDFEPEPPGRRYVVLHDLDHFKPGQVIDSVAPPTGEAELKKYLEEYQHGHHVDFQNVPRLRWLHAIRPASEEEAATPPGARVVVEEWEGRPPKVNDELVIARSKVEGYRKEIADLKAAGGRLIGPGVYSSAAAAGERDKIERAAGPPSPGVSRIGD